ncbi:MAG: hypothetical protein LBR81_04015 [Prevotellaceae bacterium]|nr:hypothetical protein [Prevotellaceae bacterium]
MVYLYKRIHHYHFRHCKICSNRGKPVASGDCFAIARNDAPSFLLAMTAIAVVLSVLVIARYETIAEDLSYQEIALLSLAMTRRRSSPQ